MRARGPPQLHIKLVQKPAREFKMKLEKTIRALKKRGFHLYRRCKQETNEIIEELRELTYAIKKEQDDALSAQDRKMKERVESRLYEIQEDFFM